MHRVKFKLDCRLLRFIYGNMKTRICMHVCYEKN